MKKKSLALVLALAMIVVCVVGGTLAWLTDKTAPVTNTFTYGDINIKLAETTGTSYKMIPGYTIAKDPKVTVLADSEKCYLFVKVAESDNFDTFMTYEMAAGWTQGDGTNIPSNVYYRVVETSTADQPFYVLAGNQVTVKDTVTKADMDGLKANVATQPTLTFTAYACQYNNSNGTNFSAIEAWNNVTT